MKTNAARVLDLQGVSYSIREFPVGAGHIDAVEVAALLEVEPERVFKTLVCTDPESGFFVFVIPGPSELDLRKAATAAGAKRIRLIPVSELTEVTGYLRGGCSPIGMKRRFPTFIEEAAGLYERIYVSAGVRGAQIEIAPDDLCSIIEASIADLV